MQLTHPTLLPAGLALLLTTTHLAAANPITPRQVELCKPSFCYPAYSACIKDCESLSNGDCFSVTTSPQCEACRVILDGCPASSGKEGEHDSTVFTFPAVGAAA